MDDMGAATGTTPKRKVFLRSTTDYIFKENRAAGIRGRSRLENPSRRRRGKITGSLSEVDLAPGTQG